MKLEQIQDSLRRRGIDGWLFFDFHRCDPIAYRILGLSADGISTRRWYYLIPAEGAPVKLVHRIESSRLDGLPGEKKVYAGWKEHLKLLQEALGNVRTIAMQYSPCNQIPYISRVDAGTVELVRSLEKQVVTSADLVQQFEACWSAEALESHLEAGRRIDGIIRHAFQEIGQRVRSAASTDEYSMQQFLLDEFERNDLMTEDPPVVAAGRNSSDPHYAVQPGSAAGIQAGDFVLLDVWAKLRKPGAVYYDVTWTGFVGPRPPEAIQKVFDIVKDARDAAIRSVQSACVKGRSLQGWEVDRVARGVIEQSGYGDCFPHRTGHSIGESVHGNGANIDDLETHDVREIVPSSGFSIEPGVYLPDFGVRSEVNMFVEAAGARVTGAVQQEIVLIPPGA